MARDTPPFSVKKLRQFAALTIAQESGADTVDSGWKSGNPGAWHLLATPVS